MSTAIDLVAPPFAGHLFPILQLAQTLRDRGIATPRLLSTSDVADTIRLCGLEPIDILPNRADEVWAIANTDARTGVHPLRLYRQFRANMALMADVAAQLRATWSTRRPALVIADFTVPVAGLIARELGIPWWTSMPSPCALESRSGTPSYLGGWIPSNTLFARTRDAIGRTIIRTFKRGVGLVFRDELRALGLRGVYRDDGSEAAYSDECILGLGMRELEFERDWPACFAFVGPLTAAPPFEHVVPEFDKTKRTILVTLGTHLPWARANAMALLERVAKELDDCVFHFAHGKPGARTSERRDNVVHYGFLPYDRYLHHYDAAIVHGGTGITYACIEAGVPMLVWPHDYDQFDHAARIVHRGLGLRLRESTVARDLRRLLDDDAFRTRANGFKAFASRYDAAGFVARKLAR
ncbi:MAG TPA: glycosyltransferase [Thermoanaerobaculia bacterium]|nr:glycosyltransferase [Thermoanaerobaculia bacterium]